MIDIISCQTCLEKHSVENQFVFCRQCANLMCDRCLRKHNNKLSEHQLIQIPGASVSLFICNKHNKEKTIFCDQCTQLVCPRCRWKEHVDHKCEELAYESDQSTGFSDDGSILNALINLKKHHSDVLRRLEENYQSLLLKLQTYQILPGVSGIGLKECSSIINGIDKITFKPEQTIPSISLGQLEVEPDKEPEGPPIIYKLKTTLVHDMLFIDKDHLITLNKDGVHVYYEGVEDTNHPLYKWCRSGPHPAPTILYAICVNRTQSTLMMTEWRTRHVGYLHKFSLTNYQYLGKFPVCAGPHLMDVTADGQVVICSYTDRQLFMYTEDGSKQPCPIISFRYRAICQLQNNRMAVCHGDDISIFDKRGYLVLSLKYQNKLVDLSDLCTDDENNLFVSDYEERSVKLYNEEGKLLRKVLDVDFNPYRLCYHPRSLAVFGIIDPEKEEYVLNVYRVNSRQEG